MPEKRRKPSEKVSHNRDTSNPGQRTPVGQKENHLFPIVGIGASAGGLEALTELLKNLPQDTGAGFVIIQHLAPAKESTRPEILQRQTHLPVSQAEDGVEVKPNTLYVIPPGKSVAILKGKLQLFDEAGNYTHIRNPIDTFLKSLALDRGPGAPNINRVDIAHLTGQVLLREFTPAYVVIDNAYNVVYVRGDTGNFSNWPKARPL